MTYSRPSAPKKSGASLHPLNDRRIITFEFITFKDPIQRQLHWINFGIISQQRVANVDQTAQQDKPPKLKAAAKNRLIRSLTEVAGKSHAPISHVVLSEVSVLLAPHSTHDCAESRSKANRKKRFHEAGAYRDVRLKPHLLRSPCSIQWRRCCWT